MTNTQRNDQVCASQIFRDNHAQRAQVTSVLALVVMLATIAVGLTGLGSLVA